YLRLGAVAGLADVGLRRRLCGGLGLCFLGFIAGRKRKLVQDLRILVADQHFGIVGKGIDERFEPDAIRLGEIAKHMVVHQFLGARMANAEAEAAIFLAEMGIQRFYPVVAAMAATRL